MMTRRVVPAPEAIKRILVRCPVTGKLTDTEQTIKEGAFAKTTRLQDETSSCVHCGKDHRWSKKDVILAR